MQNPVCVVPLPPWSELLFVCASKTPNPAHLSLIATIRRIGVLLTITVVVIQLLKILFANAPT